MNLLNGFRERTYQQSSFIPTKKQMWRAQMCTSTESNKNGNKPPVNVKLSAKIRQTGWYESVSAEAKQ